MRLFTRRSRPALWVALVLFAATAANAATDVPIYTDGLNSGFEDWSWLPHDLNNTSPVHSGSLSIQVNPPEHPHGWPAVWFRHGNLDTADYTNVTFWANGGIAGGQLLQMRSMLGTNPEVVYLLPPLPTNQWKQFVVPLALLNAQDKTNFQGIWFQMHGAVQTNSFFLDDIVLVAKTGPAPVPASASLPPLAPLAAADVGPRETRWSTAVWCIVGALVVITGLLAWMIVMLRRSGLGSSVALLPASGVALPKSGLLSEGDAEARIRAIDSTAEPGNEALRQRIASELAEFAKQSLVQGLYSQRSTLVETQKRAQAELAELEARLASLHLPLQERIRAYETRIRDLEKELETRDEEMRNMIHATLLLIRERLEEEKAKDQGPASRFN